MNLRARFTGSLLLGALLFPVSLFGFTEPDRESLPNFDRRQGALRELSPERQAAAATLTTRVPGAEVHFDPLTHVPRHISSREGTLTSPLGQGGGGPMDRDAATKAFLKANARLFGHGSDVLDKARVHRDFQTPHNGLRTVVWEQEVEGIVVFGGRLTAHTTSDGALVGVAGGFVSGPAPLAGQGAGGGVAPNAAAEALLSPAKAIAAAAVNVGDIVNPDTVVTLPPLDPAGRFQSFHAPTLKGETALRQVWLPIGDGPMRLAYEVILTSRVRDEMFRVLVDARTGEVWVRHSLTEHLSPVTYRVFASDSPSPFSPGHSIPSTNQPPLRSPELRVFPALNTNASPQGWIDDGGNETRGNNVYAHLDRNNDDQPDLPILSGSGFRVFDYPVDLSKAPNTYSNASVVELFYWANWMHDRLYDLGFTEETGNFQVSNFGRGGLGGDPVWADAQNGGATDNANFSTPPDGLAPRMQMFIWTAPEPDRDASFDAEVILHEYAHGLSQRLVGGGGGMTELQARGMGEGWSDFFALALLSESTDDLSGTYALGAYLANRQGTSSQNYYFGLRRYPYTTDLTKNPLTFKDIDPGKSSSHPDIPRNPVASPAATEVHNLGEVWCVTLWEARQRFIQKYGFETGNRLVLQLVTDGMRLCPPEPTFLEARDCIVVADRINNRGENVKELWEAFAKRGLGFSARGPFSSTTSGVQEDFDLPDDLVVRSIADLIAEGPVGGPFRPGQFTLTLSNVGLTTVRWAAGVNAPWLSLSPSAGALAAVTNNYSGLMVSFNAAARLLPAGEYQATVAVTNLESGTRSERVVSLLIGQAHYFAEIFESADNDLDFSSFTFTPNGSPAFYEVCRASVTNFWVNPTGGVGLALSDEGFFSFSLAQGKEVSIHGSRSNVFAIVSNGYLTLGSADQSRIETLASHFSRVRVAGLFDDLNPAAGGSVSWRQLEDRLAVTFVNVPETLIANSNSFQMELFFDGRIRLTYLRIDSPDGLIGLSPGLGVPANFAETDFKSLGLCATRLRIFLPPSAYEGDGILTQGGQVVLPSVATSNQIVRLSSDDASEVRVPTQVTIPAGQQEARFALTIVSDGVADGTQRAFVIASAAGYDDATASIAVLDKERGGLSINVPSVVREGNAPVLGTVRVASPSLDYLLVALSVDDPSEATVAPFVILRPGDTSVPFVLSAVDDVEIDGRQTTLVSASVENWETDRDVLFVDDNESTNLIVSLPALVREGSGLLRNSALVRIQGVLKTNLLVKLTSDSPTKITVPAVVTISAGSSAVLLDLLVLDDQLLDGLQTVRVQAEAPGFATAESSLQVSDDESPPVPSVLAPISGATNVVPNPIFSWRIVEMGPSRPTTYDVYLGTNALLGPGDLVGTTNATSFSPPLLESGVTYYWQVVARRVGTTSSPVWSFSTSGVDHFVWSVVDDVQRLGVPFKVTLAARDQLERPVRSFAGDVTLSALAELGISSPGVLITEVDNGDPDGIEFANLGTTAQNVGGWEISVYDDVIWPEPLLQFTVPAGVVCQPGAIFQLRESGPAPGTYPSFNLGTNVHWTFNQDNNPIAVLLRDASGNIIDFVCAGTATVDSIANPLPIPGSSWRGDPVPVNTSASQDYQRVGERDNNDARDWVLAPSTRAFANGGLTVPFPITGALGLTPTTARRFVNGVWSGKVTINNPAARVHLNATWGVRTGVGNGFAVVLENDVSIRSSATPDPVAVGAPVTFTVVVSNIGPATATGVVVSNILSGETPVTEMTPSRGASTLSQQIVTWQVGNLASGEAAEIRLRCRPGQAGTITNVSVVRRGESDGYVGNNTYAALVDVRWPVISIANRSMAEGDSGQLNMTFLVYSSLPPGLPITFDYMTSNATARAGQDYVAAMDSATLPVGQSDVTVSVPILGDVLFEMDETFRVILAGVSNATVARAQAIATIVNDEAVPALTVDDVSVQEGNFGTTLASFNVSLWPPSSLALVVAFTTSNGTATAGSDYLPRWGSWTFPPGATATNLAIAVVGDTAVEVDETFSLVLTNTSWASVARGRGTATILSDDGIPGQLDHFRWAPISSPQSVNRSFAVEVRAEDPSNILVSGFEGEAAFVGAVDVLDPVRVLSFIRYADTNANGEYRRTLDAISNHFTSFTESSTATTNVSLLVQQLAQADVFLIVEQEYASAGQLGPLATEWAGILSNFVYQGGVVIACSYEWDEHLFLNRSGLLSVQKRGALTGVELYGVSGHALTEGLRQPFMVPFATSYAVSNGMIILEAGTAAVVVARDVGAGHAVLLGADFFTLGTELDRVLANSVRWAGLGRTRPVAVHSVGDARFIGGVWRGEIQVAEPGDVFLVATNVNGRFGRSNPFFAQLQDDIAVKVAVFPDAIGPGAELIYTITVTNSGPTATAGVELLNRLPPLVEVVGIDGAQGNCIQEAGQIRCELGAIGPANSVSIQLRVRSQQTGLLTNVATVTRIGADAFTPNNSQTTVTTVAEPTLSISSVAVAEGDTGIIYALFPVDLSVSSARTVSVVYATCSLSGSVSTDYIRTNGVLTFLPGQRRQFVSVGVRGDRLYESSETFCVELSSPTNATLLVAQAVGTILNDDGEMPSLQVGRFLDRVVLTWLPANGLVLEQRTTLGTSEVWRPVPVTPELIAGRHVVTNVVSAAQQFYRLRLEP